MKPRILLYMLGSLLALASATQAGTWVDPSASDILYTGRWDRSNPSQPWSYWIGSSVIVRFEGTGIAATLEAGSTDYLRIIVDGDAASSTKIPVGSGAAAYVLASGLTDAVHQVEIVKETDVGVWTFFGFELDDGRSLAAPPARPPRRIEFYGDSNLAGYSLESEQNESGQHLRGSYRGYAGIVSRMLNAEYHNVSRSGATISSLHDRYDRIAYGSTNPKWNFDDFPADVVVVNLGANDVGKPEHLTRNAYHAFLDDLRSDHPSAHIMLYNAWGWDYDEPANYTHEVIAEREDPNMSSAVFPWLFEQWHGCEYDHGGMAQVLADHLASVMGWAPGPADVMSGFGVDGSIANGGFEESAPFGGYGWRYFTAAGADRVHAPEDAFEGDHHLRLADGAASHQPLPAGEGETFTLSAWMRGARDGDEVGMTVDFRDQEMWTTPLQTTTESRALTTGWQRHVMSATAPTGTPRPVFHARVTFTAGDGDTVDIDAVAMTPVTGIANPGTPPPVRPRLTASPNPFRSAVGIAFRIPHPGPVLLVVYDLSGRRVATLVDAHREAGDLAATWDGRDHRGREAGSGIYFLRAVAAEFTAAGRIVLVR